MNPRVSVFQRMGLPIVAALFAIMMASPAGSAPTVPAGMTEMQAEAARRIPNLQYMLVDKGGIPSHVRGDLGSFKSQDNTPDAAATIFLKEKRELLRADGSESLQLRKLNRHPTRGMVHYRMKQLIDGLEVIGGEIIFHVEESTFEIRSIDAQFLPAEALPRKPAIAGNIAIANVVAALNATNVEYLREPRLAFARAADASGHLAWVSRVRYLDADGRQQIDDLLVDAINGQLVQRLPQVRYVLNREIRNYQPDFLILPEIGLTLDQEALKVHQYSGDTYNYFWTFFGRDAPQGNGALMRSYIHGTDWGQSNAYYFLGDTYFGDGDNSTYGPFSSARDVVAHEWTHGVTATEAGLVYSGESGALDESISDALAAAVEAWATGGVSLNTWKAGEDMYTPFIANDALRYMDNPTRDGRSRDFYPELQPADDVHYGSGIGNLAFSLIAKGGLHPGRKTAILVEPAGINAAARIFYLALRDHLQSNDGYVAMAMNTSIVAAQEFGYGSLEHGSTCRAWRAVGVPVNPALCAPPPPPASVAVDTNSCPGKLNVSWTAVPEATSYEVYFSTRANFSVIAGSRNVPAPATSLLVSTPSNQAWYYKVASCTAIGCGEMSAMTTPRANCWE